VPRKEKRPVVMPKEVTDLTLEDLWREVKWQLEDWRAVPDSNGLDTLTSSQCGDSS